MIKVLIADDEKKICILISKLIDWEALGMEIVCIVNNGTDALEKAIELKPDIIIADIKMPGLDGIQLIEKLVENGLQSRLIIISGYKQFEYAHSAINFGVESYLLKPIDKVELERALTKIATSMKSDNHSERDRQKRKIQRHFLENVINKQERTDIEIDKINNKYELNFKQGAFQSLFIKVDKNDQTYDVVYIYGLFMEELEVMGKPENTEYIFRDSINGILAIINYDIKMKEDFKAFYIEVFKRLKKISDKFSNMKLTMGIGFMMPSISSVYLSIRSSMDAVKLRIFIGQNRIIDINDQDRYLNALDFQELGTIGMQLEVALESFDDQVFADKLMQLIHANADMIRKDNIVIFRIVEYVESIVVKKFKEMGLSDEELKQTHEEFEGVYLNSITETSMIHSYKELTKGLIRRLKDEKEGREINPIRVAKKYIAENFNKQVSLESVADQIGLSPAYLSTLFKNELGINFSDYLIQCRINMAKKLLKSTNYSIQEITEAIGYKDTKYFSKLFNKTVGLKPSVYKKLHS